MVLCLLLDQPDEGCVAAIAERAPRIAVEAGARVWVDARGLDARMLFARLSSAVRSCGRSVRGGVASVPIAAHAAAWCSSAHDVRVVKMGEERGMLASLPLSVLEVEDRVLALLEGVGVSTCGELASLARESVEVRFGAEAVQAWRWSRGEDERRLFRPHPPEEPHASIDFVDYVVTDPERLLFTANALLGSVCDALVERGSHARRMLLQLPLADGTKWQRELRPARATADRTIWLRLLRSVLERLTVQDAVAGMHIEVRAAEAASAVQGDLFDAGFATASAVVDAVGRLLESNEEVIAEAVPSAHPLVEERVSFDAVKLERVMGPPALPGAEGLTLHLLSQPQPILVETIRRRDHEVPVRYQDGAWKSLLHVAGPDRLSGGQWDQTYAREYYRGVTAEGALVWLYRDACRDRWYLHGYWS